MMKNNKINTTIHRKTRETEIRLEYENVGPESPGKVSIVINVHARGDFAHHVIEDLMRAINELAEMKGVSHKIV